MILAGDFSVTLSLCGLIISSAQLARRAGVTRFENGFRLREGDELFACRCEVQPRLQRETLDRAIKPAGNDQTDYACGLLRSEQLIF